MNIRFKKILIPIYYYYCFSGCFQGESGLPNSCLVFFLHLLQKRTFVD